MKAFLISILLVALTTSFILYRQNDSIKEKRSNLELLNNQFLTLEREHVSSVTNNLSAKSPSTGDLNTPSHTLILANEKISEIMNKMRKLNPQSTELFSLCPELLKAVEPLETNELMRRFSELETSTPSGPESIIAFILATLISEDQPMLILQSDMEKISVLHDNVKTSAFASLMRQDLSAAQKWLESTTGLSDQLANKLRSNLGMALLAKSPKEAIRFFKSSIEATAFRMEIIGLPEEITAEQSIQLGKTLSSESDQSLRNLFSRHIFTKAMDMHDINQLRESVDAFYPDQDGESKAKILLNSSIEESITSGQDADDFIKYISELSPESTDTATINLVDHWVEKDFNATAKWLQNFPDSSARNAGITSFINSITSINPEAALEWAFEVTDQEQSEKLQKQVYENWLKIEEPAARAWAKKNGEIE